jgi:hypothetical protein
MGFTIRHYPEDVSILEDKLQREGSHYFYNMYIKRVECWVGSDNSKQSELFIENFMKKYNETNIEFHNLSDKTETRSE